jgi:hypothetical protein
MLDLRERGVGLAASAAAGVGLMVVEVWSSPPVHRP